MLYENIKKILDKAKEEDIQILTAKDILIKNDPEAEQLEKDYEVLKTYYKFITTCRRNENEEAIKKLCELYEKEDHEAIRELIKEILPE